MCAEYDRAQQDGRRDSVRTVAVRGEHRRRDGVRREFCISTFSSGVVNAAVRSQSLFQPELPTWKADAFGKAQLGVYTKIFLHYEKGKFWADAVKSRRFFCAGSRQGSGFGLTHGAVMLLCPTS